MTKVEAIIRVLKDNNGVSNWNIIYNQLEKYYPDIKNPKDWKAAVRGVLYRDLNKNFKMIGGGLIALIDFNEDLLALEENIEDTSKSIQTKIRIGQEKFRKKLLKKLAFCPITSITEKRLLVASHIKPWAVSSNFERLDINNGFIFSPTIDKLFDSGLISFQNNKTIIISPALSKGNIKNIGIERKRKYCQLPIDNRINYLHFHRENIFIDEN